MNPYLETWGFDLWSVDGYQAWCDACGHWPDETPERVKAYREAQEAAEEAIDDEAA